MKLNNILEKHAPYNNIHLPIQEVHPLYINNSNKNPQNQLRSISTMVNFPQEDQILDYSKNKNIKHLAQVGESLISDKQFIPINRNSRSQTPYNYDNSSNIKTPNSNHKNNTNNELSSEKIELKKKIEELTKMNLKYDY